MTPAFTNRQKAQEARREVAMREQVYGRRVMTAKDRHRIALMQEIAEDYERQAEREEGAQGELF
jgi:transposase